MASSFWFCAAATAVIVPIVVFAVHKSVWVELEIVTAVLSGLLFVYFTVILHQGVRFTKDRKALIDWPVGRPTSLADYLLIPDTGYFTAAGAEWGCLGILIGFLLDVAAVIVLVFLISVLLWLGISAIAAVILFLYWVHTRWLRYLVTTGRHCRGNWAKSLAHGAVTSLRFTLWFYAAFFLAQRIDQWRLTL